MLREKIRFVRKTVTVLWTPVSSTVTFGQLLNLTISTAIDKILYLDHELCEFEKRIPGPLKAPPLGASPEETKFAMQANVLRQRFGMRFKIKNKAR